MLDVIRDEQLCSRADEIGARCVTRLDQFAARDNLTPITGIRTLGAMTAFDVVGDPARGVSAAEIIGRLRRHALEAGLIILSYGTDGQTIRLLAPLTISDAHLDEGLNILEIALGKAMSA